MFQLQRILALELVGIAHLRFAGALRAIAALVLAVLPVLPGFVRAATTPGGQVAGPGVLDMLYTYAWFVTFALSAVIYLAMMRGRTSRSLPLV